ncbi:hypothetical protein PPM_p0120 (plasmid) [Paenibacillus polymyxa M1]|uniref:hypothetical protein n=1 Tax=Paenibacillus polymyxa TaxID=1406 RepID=UPI00021BBB64|nr:hypothetical protein [Paenibacillus polymyxa]CCC86270.1 hypothetical protein PPM_p0120 [Paenibacillus polymyxa M1]
MRIFANFFDWDIDVVIDDGYGRTANHTLHLLGPPNPMDFILTNLTLMDGFQFWLKRKYVRENFNGGDYIYGYV